MRCRICGRPIGETESLKASERKCAGCEADFEALKAETEIVFELMELESGETVPVEIGERPVRSVQVAFDEAKKLHQAREVAYNEAAVKIMRQRVAAGFSAVDGVTPLQDVDWWSYTDPDTGKVSNARTAQELPAGAVKKTTTVAEMKARAFAALEAETAHAAFEADLAEVVK